MTKSTNVKRAPATEQVKAPTKKTAAPAVAKPAISGPEETKQPAGKLGILVGLLRRSDGARIPEMQEATGWQAHSIRGAMSGAIKKKLGVEITSSAAEGGRTYRITDKA